MDNEATTDEAGSPKRRGKLIRQQVDRMVALVHDVENIKGRRIIKSMKIDATEPHGWSLTIDMEPDEMGNPRESMHYDSKEELVSSLIQEVMGECAQILTTRVREAEATALRYRTAIVRSIPPSERAPITKRRRGKRRATNSGRAPAPPTAEAGDV
jgi:hypothetical protein